MTCSPTDSPYWKNDKAAEMLFSYAASRDSSYGPKAAKARLDYGMDLLNRARAATGEERQKLKEESLRYVSKEIADQAVPPPGEEGPALDNRPAE